MVLRDITDFHTRASFDNTLVLLGSAFHHIKPPQLNFSPTPLFQLFARISFYVIGPTLSSRPRMMYLRLALAFRKYIIFLMSLGGEIASSPFWCLISRNCPRDQPLLSSFFPLFVPNSPSFVWFWLCELDFRPLRCVGCPSHQIVLLLPHQLS